MKEQRKAAGFTQADLAEKLNIHLQTVSKWERGISEPDISQLGELAQALGVTLEKLCGQQESGETYVGKFQAERFGKMLGEQRASCGESQEQLAAALAVSTDAISRWERGITCPDIEQLSLLAEHFGLPVSRLYCGIETEEEAEEEAEESGTVRKRHGRRSFFWWLGAGVSACAVGIAGVAFWRSAADAAEIPDLPETYTVSLDGREVSVTENDWFAPPDPVREGYEFIGWEDESGQILTFPRKIEEDISCTPVFEAVEYTVDYWLNGGYVEGTVQNTFTMETGTLKLPVPEKEGQIFEGWYLTADYSGVPVERIECTCSDVKVYARWSDATYTVLYELDGGTMYEKNPESVTAETEYTLADPVREGYRFLGWYDLQNGDRYETIGGEHAKNLILCALWQKTDVHFSVRYECDGEVLGENPVSVGAGEVYKLYGAKKTGHDFVGWNTRADGGGEYLEYLCDVEESLCLYAIFQPKEYLIRYEYEGMYESGKINPNHIAYGERVELCPVYLYGHTFIGWFDEKEGGTRVEIIDENNVTELTALYARFKPLQFEIALDAGAGVFQTPEGERSAYVCTLSYGETLTLPECVRGGYVFLGWENEEGEIVREIDRSNAGDMSLTAAWRASDEGYAITYVLDGGKTDKPNPEQVLCGEILTLNAPVKEGYVFLGWYDNPEGRGTRYVCTPAGREADLTLYALWQEIVVSGSYENFEYQKTDTEVTITKYNGPTGANVDVVIPAVVDGLQVTKIGSGTAGTDETAGVFAESDTVVLRSLTIPEGVVQLLENAFVRLRVEEPVQIPSTVVSVGYGCFNGFDGRVTFSEGGNLFYIGPYAFRDVKFDGVLVLPEGITTIDRGGFYSADASAVILPDTIEKIFDSAFYQPNYLIKIFVPSSIKYVGNMALTSNRVYTSLASEQVDAVEGLRNASPVCGVRESAVTLTDGDESEVLTGYALALPRRQKEGYTFLGWRDESGEIVSDCYIPDRPARLTAAYERQTPSDGRAMDRAALLRPDTDCEVVILEGEAFYFQPDVRGNCGIVISVVLSDFRIGLYRVRNNQTEGVAFDWTIEHAEGDVYYILAETASAGTLAKLRFTEIPF